MIDSGDSLPRLLRLPTELLLHIISYLRRNDALCKLALSCRRFNTLATPVLYRSLIYPAYFNSRSGIRATGIMGLDELLSTLRVRPQLGVLTNTLHCGFTYSPNNETSYDIHILLYMLPNLKSCHLAIYGYLDFKPHATVTELDLNFYESDEVTLSFFQLHKNMCLPGLQKFTVGDVSDWTMVGRQTRDASSSDLKHLYITSSAGFDNGFAEMLTWPKQLLSFQVQFYPGLLNSNDRDISSRSIIEALLPHKSWLTSLQITGASPNKPGYGSTTQSHARLLGSLLHSFRAIKDLSLTL